MYVPPGASNTSHLIIEMSDNIPPVSLYIYSMYIYIVILYFMSITISMTTYLFRYIITCRAMLVSMFGNRSFALSSFSTVWIGI